MNDELIKRIGDNYLPANHKDGDTFLHTDYNEFLSIFKTAINENYFDIQKIINGSIKVSDSSKLNGASLSQSVNGILSSDDNTVPSSKQVKEYIDDQYEDLQSKNDVLSETVSNNTESIKVFNDSVTELKDSKANVSETGNSIEILLNNENYIITVRLLDKTGKELSTSNIDLPLESVVVGAEYIDGTKTIRLSLRNGEYIDVPVSSLVSGLVSDETFNRKVEELQNQIDNKISNIPLATENIIGGVKPVAKTEDMTTPVGVDEYGKLYTSDIGDIPPEESGATFTPSVSVDGIISWTNDKGLENPESVNIKGPQGIRGIQGENGITPNISIGTVTTLDPNEQATVTKTGTDEEPIFNFGIPKGEKGDMLETNNSEICNSVSVVGMSEEEISESSLDFPIPKLTIQTVIPYFDIADVSLDNHFDISKYILDNDFEIYNIDADNLIPNYVKTYKDLSNDRFVVRKIDTDNSILMEGNTTKAVTVDVYDSSVDVEKIYLPAGGYVFDQKLHYDYGTCHIIYENSNKEDIDIHQDSNLPIQFDLSETCILKKVYIVFNQGVKIFEGRSKFVPTLRFMRYYNIESTEIVGVSHKKTLETSITLFGNKIIPRNPLNIYSCTGDIKTETRYGYAEFPVSTMEDFGNGEYGWSNISQLYDDIDIENSIYANSSEVFLGLISDFYSTISYTKSTKDKINIVPTTKRLKLNSSLSYDEFKNTYKDLVIKVIYEKKKNVEEILIGNINNLSDTLRTRIGKNCFVIDFNDDTIKNSSLISFNYAVDSYKVLEEESNNIYARMQDNKDEIMNTFDEGLYMTVGDLEQLQTTDKNSVVGAVNSSSHLIKDFTVESDTNEITINDLNLEIGKNYRLLVNGASSGGSGLTNITLLPNGINSYSVSRVVGMENNNGSINSVFNTNIQGLYIGRVYIGNNYSLDSLLLLNENFAKNISQYGTPGPDGSYCFGNLSGIVNIENVPVTSLKIKIASGQIKTGTNIKIYML